MALRPSTASGGIKGRLQFQSDDIHKLRDEFVLLKEEIRVLRKGNEEFEDHARRELQILPKDIASNVKKLQTDLIKLRHEFTCESKCVRETLDRTEPRITQLDQQIANVNKQILDIRDDIGSDSMHAYER